MSNTNFNLKAILDELHCFAYKASNIDGKWISSYIGKSLEQLTGINSTLFTDQKKDWLEVIHPDDKERVLWESETLYLSPGSNLCQEYRIIHKSGEIVWIRDLKHSKFEKEIFYVFGIVVDITEQKKLEQKNNELLQEIINKNKRLHEALQSIQIINTHAQRENDLLKENIFLQTQKDIVPLLDQLRSDENSKTIRLIEENLIKIFQRPSISTVLDTLTKRENKIAGFIKAGYTHKEISTELNICVETVKTHVKHIKRKMSIGKERSLYSALKNS